MTPRNAYLKAKKAKKRIPTLEPVIASDAEAAYLYSRDVIKGRWREAEPLICGDHSTAIHYASVIIGGRWKALEAVLNDPWDCFLYAAIVIRGRWKKAESIIRTDPGAATRYAEEILKAAMANG